VFYSLSLSHLSSKNNNNLKYISSPQRFPDAAFAADLKKRGLLRSHAPQILASPAYMGNSGAELAIATG
jgi:hypothetical protein